MPLKIQDEGGKGSHMHVQQQLSSAVIVVVVVRRG